MMRKYTARQLMEDFPDDAACLAWLLAYTYPYGIFCVKCQKITPHYAIRSRRSYSCQFCGHHVHPTANTIFHRTTTPLTTWFYVIGLMMEKHCKVSIRQVQRETGMVYKTAWRMCHLIRSKLEVGADPFGRME